MLVNLLMYQRFLYFRLLLKSKPIDKVEEYYLRTALN